MFSWFLALALAALLWSAAAAWLWLVKRRKTEIHHGLAALAGMRWREFSQIVRHAMAAQRGLQPLADADDNDRGTSSDFLLQRDGQRWLVSCKHGRAYRFDASAVHELGDAMRLTGASAGILLTEGHVERDGMAEAGKQSIEIVDGRSLWPLLAPYVSAEMRDMVTGIARREAIRQTGIAGLAAVTFGLLVGMGYMTVRGDGNSDAPPDSPRTAAPAAPAAAPAQPPAPAADTTATRGTATAQEAGNLIADPDPETLLRYQQAVSRSLARTPGLVSGIWLTRSTLSIERSGDDATVWPLICAELERYPSLRTTRVQLNPRPGVDEPVRWRQCRTY